MKFFGICVYFAVAFLIAASDSSRAQDTSPPAELESIIDQLARADARPAVTLNPALPKAAPLAPEAAPFAPGGKTDKICNMQHFDLTLTNDDQSNTFAVLIDPQDAGHGVRPRRLFAKTTVLHVDADGSLRAYHPDDPLGQGTCKLSPGPTGGYVADGVCATDTLHDATIRIFRNDHRLTGDDFVQAWRSLWPLIRDKKLKPFDLSKFPDLKAPKNRYGFYDPSTKLMVWFNHDIIPADDGRPCMRGAASRFAGYFVAATALSNAKDQPGTDIENADLIAPKACTPLRFIDAERVPFFVLPGGGLGEIAVGDIVIAYTVINNEERFVFALAADSGPSQSFGEASVALIQKLLKKQLQPIMNNAELNGWDISGDEKEQVEVSILVIGGTKDLLNGNYTAANVEAIGRQAFKKWNGPADDIGQRLRSCAKQAIANGKK